MKVMRQKQERQVRMTWKRRIQWDGLLPAFDEGLIDATDLWKPPFTKGAVQLHLLLRWLIGVPPRNNVSISVANRDGIKKSGLWRQSGF